MNAKEGPDRSADMSESPSTSYNKVLNDLLDLLQQARRSTARAVNSVMTATYWEIGRRIVENEQKGEARAEYGQELIKRLATDLTAQFGRGFSARSHNRYRAFYIAWEIVPTLLTKSHSTMERNSDNSPTRLAESHKSFPLNDLADHFPLPWSHYAYLLAVRNPLARKFYEAEALRGGWSVRQLRRQIDSQFYERTALSTDKASMLNSAGALNSAEESELDDSIKDPFVLEFLGLKDEYSESDLEEALILHLETFLLEMGNAFAFVGRQRRLRIDDEWYRVDLLFYHRRLRCLIVIDLKLGRFTHADAGQMNLYLNYAREHWVEPGENPPIGITLCASKSESLVRYATDGLPNKLLVREYLTVLPDEQLLADEIARTRRELESRSERET